LQLRNVRARVAALAFQLSIQATVAIHLGACRTVPVM
jgi:hypothetical protein